MKTSVLIENGRTKIILTPENDFEKDIIEKLYIKKEKHELITTVQADYNYATYNKHKIILNIKELM